MGFRGLGLAVVGFVGAAGAAFAQAPTTAGPGPDYRADAAWLCRPGKQALCTTGLDARRIEGASLTPEPFVAATADPKVDCFYVYPTVSRQGTPLSDLAADPEELNVVRAQAARFSARCRVFAPLYRQVTLAGLNPGAGAGRGTGVDWSPAYADVLAAWRDYLARDNHGRGFILIGHSQGSIHLARLIQQEIEGKPVAGRMIAAYLAGHPQVTVPVGADVGGTFQSTHLCRSKTQIGCAVVWSSYDGSAMPPMRIFERAPDPGLNAVCVSPAALVAGTTGKTPLEGYLNKPREAPADDPPYLHDIGGYQGECIDDEKGAVLKVTVTPGPGAELRQRLLTATSSRSPNWGLHGLDVSLSEGSLLTLADSQIAAYLSQTGGR